MLSSSATWIWLGVGRSGMRSLWRPRSGLALCKCQVSCGEGRVARARARDVGDLRGDRAAFEVLRGRLERCTALGYDAEQVRIRYAAKTDVGMKRTHNEDYFAL